MTNDERARGRGPTLVDVRRSFGGPVFHELYDEVLAPSLPASELEPKEDLEARLAGAEPGRTMVNVALHGDGRVVGGVVSEWYPASRCLLVAYLAVRPSLRGRGIGRALMEAVLAGPRAERGPLLVLGEVDDPRVAVDDAGAALARLRFFDRLSARLVRLPYVQPEVRPGQGRVRMLLLCLWADAAVLVDGEAVRAEVVRRFLEDYFVRIEGSPLTADGGPEGLLSWTASADAIPLLPLERFDELPGSGWESPR